MDTLSVIWQGDENKENYQLGRVGRVRQQGQEWAQERTGIGAESLQGKSKGSRIIKGTGSWRLGGGGGEGECLQERGEERLGSRILKVMEGIVKKFSLSNIPSFLYKSIENHKN